MGLEADIRAVGRHQVYPRRLGRYMADDIDAPHAHHLLLQRQRHREQQFVVFTAVERRHDRVGIHLFGRGTPYGLDVAPVIKVCSRNEMKDHWFDLIDISAGHIATGEATIADVGTEIFNLILDVASGTKQPYSDQYGFHNDMCIFNPAPIT